MKENKTYSVFDLIEDKEVLTHVSGREASEFLGVRTCIIHAYSVTGKNLFRRYRITRNEPIKDLTDEWILDFKKEWEFTCNYLNPNRKCR